MRVTNALLGIIIVLLAMIAVLLYRSRPVTLGELLGAAESGKTEEVLMRSPLVRVQGGTVEVTNSVDVNVSEPLPVRIEP